MESSCITDPAVFNLKAHKEKEHGRLRTWVKGKYVFTYKVVWEQINGAVPPGLQLNHRCNNTTCINPAHLYVGTQKESMRDRKAVGNTNRGKTWKIKAEKVRYAKLSAEKHNEIREKYFLIGGYTQQQLASLYAVSQCQISKVLKARS